MMFRLNPTIALFQDNVIAITCVEARPLGRNVADTINYSLASLIE